MVAEAPGVFPSTLSALETALLNTAGNVPLHNRFRALFTLKALKNDEAVRIISKGVFFDKALSRSRASFPRNFQYFRSSL